MEYLTAHTESLLQYGFGGAVAAAMLFLHWMSLRGFARMIGEERNHHREQLKEDRVSHQKVWEQFVQLKLQHHTEVMRVLSEHSALLAEIRVLCNIRDHRYPKGGSHAEGG